MILKIISEKSGIFDQRTASFCKNFVTTLVFEKNACFWPKIGNSKKM
jgi:hypothetical protein